MPKPLLINNKIAANHWPDWSEKEKYLVHDLNQATYLWSNASIYFVGKEIRYIKTNGGLFELATVNAIPELSAILLTCKRKTTLAPIYELMRYSFDLDEKSTQSLLMQMVHLQLLQNDLQPNITGEDFFTKIGVTASQQANDYIIAERTLLAGNFDGQLLKQIPEMINFFTKTFASQANTDLTNFKHAFMKRFENQEIDLATVMDPEIGIGYGDLAQASGTDLLVDEIRGLHQKIPTASIGYGKLQQFLLKKMIAHDPINLAEFTDFNTETASLPNTFSLLFHLYKGQLVVAHAGGCTANALLGRFTMANTAIENMGREIATLEMQANPEVSFFDIAYQAEKKVDNVNRRKRLYDHELPILTWSDTEAPLDLADLLVSIEQDEVILKSKKLGKRLIPRVPSAYNYTRSDLAVYRFLCDIQSQGLLTNLSFKLQDFFPNLGHYPRVSYKGVIVSPAMWLLPIALVKNMDHLKTWLMAQKIDNLFKVGYSDQSLTFDPKNIDDLAVLLTYIKQQTGDIYLTEALLDEIDYIKDEKGNSYSPQYLVNYYHKNELYKASLPQPKQARHSYLPGSDWLYFEIYCHPAKSNYLLMGLIAQFLKINSTQLKKWFFIRYTDPKPHIRLRLHLKNRAKGFEIMNALQQLIEQEIKIGFVNDYKLQTYQPETQRYGAKRMDLVAYYFKLDSEYVFKLLLNSKNEEQLSINVIYLIESLLDICMANKVSQIRFVKAMAQSFATEMNLEAASFKKINTNFNQLKGNLEKAIVKLPQSLIKKYHATFCRVMDTCENEKVKQQILADFIHMHINRLFMTEQRIHETIIYHYLLRVLQAKQAISKVVLE